MCYVAGVADTEWLRSQMMKTPKYSAFDAHAVQCADAENMACLGTCTQLLMLSLKIIAAVTNGAALSLMLRMLNDADMPWPLLRAAAKIRGNSFA